MCQFHLTEAVRCLNKYHTITYVNVLIQLLYVAHVRIPRIRFCFQEDRCERYKRRKEKFFPHKSFGNIVECIANHKST